MNDRIRSFAELSARDVQTAGGKGANLGAMFNYNIPVPDGFVITTSCYNQFLESNDLSNYLESQLVPLDINDVDKLERASDNIIKRILQAEIPVKMKEDIKGKFSELNTSLVAVRSSANAEDGDETAWAGQLETFLGTTSKDLLTNIKKCWASLFSSRAISYRFQNKLMDTRISVAVVVQQMIDSEIAGVAFSVHPVTQDKNEMIIEAGYGLGESVVSGSITPDSYVVNKSQRKIIETYISEQTKAIYLNKEGGSNWKAVPDKLTYQAKLSNETILDLADIIVRVEKFFKFPCDIEWARKGGKFYILQCRPITTLT